MVKDGVKSCACGSGYTNTVVIGWLNCVHTRTTVCTPNNALPANSMEFAAGKVQIVFSGVDPTGTWSTPAKCVWACKSGFHLEGGQCVSNVKPFNCAPKPEPGTAWNTVSSYTQTWNGSAWTPVASTTSYSTTPSTTACFYKCAANYHRSGSICESNTRTWTCTGTTPAYSRWTPPTITQTWNASKSIYEPACSWSCNTGYTKDAAGTACVDNCTAVPNYCPDKQPQDYCESADKAKHFKAWTSGCAAGVCQYPAPTLESCTHGCRDGKCLECLDGPCCDDGRLVPDGQACNDPDESPLDYSCSTETNTCDSKVRAKIRVGTCNGSSGTCQILTTNPPVEWRVWSSCGADGFCDNSELEPICKRCENGCFAGGCELTLPSDPASNPPAIDPTKPYDFAGSMSFLWDGPKAVQKGLDSRTIDPRKVTVVRGLVLDQQNLPIPGVTVTVHGHPEYGSTRSRLDGNFDIAVNAGGFVTLNLRKLDYLPAQRRIFTRAGSWDTMEEVALVKLPPQDVEVTLDGTSTVHQFVGGEPVVDARGSRKGDLLLSPGTKAIRVMEDGSQYSVNGPLSMFVQEYTSGVNYQNA
ncbi:MAG: carboxypeptidase-like regulatory domain-containing protein, partial [Myxococcota bacterium]|nr:carboxypeptidase-like regulatory domain-containing protein [Myxococcota bacterium]